MYGYRVRASSRALIVRGSCEGLLSGPSFLASLAKPSYKCKSSSMGPLVWGLLWGQNIIVMHARDKRPRNQETRRLSTEQGKQARKPAGQADKQGGKQASKASDVGMGVRGDYE